MTKDPIRWLQDPGLNPGLDELLRSAPMPLDLPDAVAARVGSALQQLAGPVGNPGLGTQSGTPGAAATTPRLGMFKWLAGKPALVVGAVGLSAVVAGLVEQRSSTHATRDIASISATTAIARTAADSSATPLALDAQASRVAVANANDTNNADRAAPNGIGTSANARVSANPAALAPAPVTHNVGTSLAKEARLLESVRVAVSADPALARRKLAEYDARFPNGALQQERALLAVKLAVAEGRRGEAQVSASELEQTAKTSPYAKKARELVNTNERAATSRTTTE